MTVLVPDVAVVYELVTPAHTILFNDGDIPSFDDMYFITGIRGLRPPIRNPQWERPQGDGGLPGRFRRGAAHPIFEGEYLVQSTRVDNEIQVIRNGMDQELTEALESILDPFGTAGTLTWTPGGLSELTVDVFYEQTNEPEGIEQRTFTFGLYIGDPVPA